MSFPRVYWRLFLIWIKSERESLKMVGDYIYISPRQQAGDCHPFRHRGANWPSPAKYTFNSSSIWVSGPRDMLFAHLPCLRVGLGPSELHPLLRVDYGKTAAEVYSNVAKYFIFTRASLKILSHTEHTWSWGIGQNIPNLPSWCPNWTAKHPPSCYGTLESLHIKWSLTRDNDDFDFNPHSFSERFGPGSFTLWTSQSLIACVGISFGPIKQVSESPTDKLATFTFNSIDFIDTEAPQELRNWDGLIRSGSEFYEYWNGLLGPIFAQAEHVPLELSSPY
jgi:hypothetical protein